MVKTTPSCLMVQGTGSNVGKSLITAGLCRLFSRKGLRVAPFKPQNMSNNAAVTADGGEIGRAQALQAKACGLLPSVLMNPVLLKPEAEQKAQLVVRGKAIGRYSATKYHDLKPKMLKEAIHAYQELARDYDMILIEGAGSPAEVNLRAGDLANMGFAEAINAPVLLVADIHRGGVIANLIGTHLLLSPSEQNRLVGYVVNQFRGDVSLFLPALATIKEHTGMDSMGVVPYYPEAESLPAEDAMEILGRKKQNAKIKIIVPRLARIANFDDLDPLMAEPDVSVEMITAGTPLPQDADLILIPGSKATISDMAFIRAQGWDIDMHAHLRRGGMILGICAGYQILGETILDPMGIEGSNTEIVGLGFLRHTTVMAKNKHLTQHQGHDRLFDCPVSGYEMHIGETTGEDCARPMLYIDDTPYGGRSREGLVMGCYLHGLFARDAFRKAFLYKLQPQFRGQIAHDALIEKTLDGLADHLEKHMHALIERY